MQYIDAQYMKNYNKRREESFIQYLDENNLHGWGQCLKNCL